MPGIDPPARADRVASADVLRGIAAMCVAWFHFTNGGALLPDGWLKASGSQGWLGVHAFFVISGFVIPLSMWRAGYVPRLHAAAFLAKRLIRLEPPYLLAVALCVLLGFLSSRAPGFAGAPFDLDLRQLLLHVGYLNGFFDVPWLNPVFWSLAIEFQFYICMMALYPGLMHRRRAVAIPVLAGAVLLALLQPGPVWVSCYGPLFAFGILAFWHLERRIDTLMFLVLTGLNAALALATLGAAATLVGACTALVLCFARLPAPRGLLFLGTVSYSLYLLHVPIGGRVVNLGARFADGDASRVLVLAAAVAASLLAAWGFYRLIERPAREWSARVRYRPSAGAAA